MTSNVRLLLFPMLVGTLFSVVTPAQLAAAERKVIEPRHQVSGINRDEGVLKLRKPFLTSEKEYKELWNAWHKGEPPKVDFKKELVLVTTVGGPNVPHVGVSLMKNGNLRWGGASTLRGGQGFGYWIGIVSRDGVKKLNGKDIRRQEKNQTPSDLAQGLKT